MSTEVQGEFESVRIEGKTRKSRDFACLLTVYQCRWVTTFGSFIVLVVV